MQFQNWLWSRDIFITEGGKQLIQFPPDFPLQLNPYRFSVDHRLTLNYHDFLEITYICEGAGTFRVEDKNYRARKGDIFVVGNTQFHTLKTNYKEPIKVLCLYFMPDLVYRAGASPLDFEYIRPFYNHSIEHHNIISAGEDTSTAIFRILKKIHKEIALKSKYYQLAVKNQLCDILLLLVHYYKDFSPISRKKHNRRLRDIERLKKVFGLLQNTYQKKVTLSEAAKEAYMSPYYFCKFFKKVTGSGFAEYVMRMRIDKAKELLLQHNLPVSQIAYEVGFESLSYFDRAFRRFTQLSPKEFIRTVSGKK